MCIRDSHQAEAGSFLPIDLHDSHGELRTLFLVEAQEVGVVLLADLVTGQDDDVLGIICLLYTSLPWKRVLPLRMLS